ncbi:hypothetical protein B0T26DRAFT_873553 [Lasiosphaeria miniovina]|uniref:Uncharacterized protein n=1 Tax=Lasiosphaeria miniovina TaxID=1954250 RepID=A0AA40DU27_9PEZI|nr:uncharacterized protein B0T26DRAFT_873553 [Lasiosphaeria miniovina]KAK0713377.1 hypothetical protein B0T26DRAFT_873553 [Lasiosphaeria miniovina]
MGVAVSAAGDEVRKQNDDTEKITDDALNSIIDLVKLYKELFKAHIKNILDSTSNKVTKLTHEETVLEYEASKIADHVKDVAAAIGDALSVSLEALFESSTANSNEVSMVFVTASKLDYPYHVDMHLYTYSFTSATLTKVAENVLAVSPMILSVDLSPLTESDLGVDVDVCYRHSDEAARKPTLEKLKAAREAQIQEKKGAASAAGGSTSNESAKASLQAGHEALDDGLGRGGAELGRRQAAH